MSLTELTKREIAHLLEGETVPGEFLPFSQPQDPGPSSPSLPNSSPGTCSCLDLRSKAVSRQGASVPVPWGGGLLNPVGNSLGMGLSQTQLWGQMARVGLVHVGLSGGGEGTLLCP